jgi:hypothetical protein
MTLAVAASGVALAQIWVEQNHFAMEDRDLRRLLVRPLIGLHLLHHSSLLSTIISSAR